ncbi:hypothetical protein OIDMADRAFT_146499 [Oidiodendron maius Zn]|uniref:Uncharacterized protein n=1 Tax=Oidiodendron maius (strain Zn) TaxID=913774 RepID=A0A0C3GRV9_OIDMZ|nr:hypothetical protein OIDMADRAFT_146499 [Oidiodendron maius Zn]
MLVDMAKLVFGDGSSSTQRLQQLAANANNKQLSGISSKYWRYLRSFPKFIQNRNEMANKSDKSEVEFAGFLLAVDDKSNCDFWKEPLPLLYNGSIEKVAARESRRNMLKSLRY